MELSTAQQILVVVLSTALAIFLILSIVIAVMIVKLLASLRRVADKAENLVQSAEQVGEMIRNVASPTGMFRFGRFVFDMVSKHAKQTKAKE